MKKIFYIVTIVGLLFSCGKKTGSLTVNGNIEGLKKGTLYLQKYQDTLLVTVDSIQLVGESEFTLVDEIQEPEIYYLILGEKPDEKISFFAEKGMLTITSKLSNFTTSAKITGSERQELLEQYLKIIRQFNGKQLDNIKAKFDAQRNKDIALLTQITKDEENLLKRRYLFTTNFAVNNGKSEVAPYIALNYMYYANIKLLDTVNNSLSKKIQHSKYGKQLDQFIANIKENEK